MSVYLTWCSSVISSSTVELSSADVSCVLLQGAASGSKLKRPTFHSSRGSLTGENGGTSKPSRTGETTDTFLLCAFYVGNRLIFMLIFSRHKISLVHLRRLACYGLTLKLSWGWIEIENNFSRECFFLQGEKKKGFFPRLKLTDGKSFGRRFLFFKAHFTLNVCFLKTQSDLIKMFFFVSQNFFSHSVSHK